MPICNGKNLIKSLCLFCIFTSGFIEAFEIAEIETSVPQEIASSQTWWVLFIWLIVNFVTWLTGVLGTCSSASPDLFLFKWPSSLNAHFHYS